MSSIKHVRAVNALSEAIYEDLQQKILNDVDECVVYSAFSDRISATFADLLHSGEFDDDLRKRFIKILERAE